MVLIALILINNCSQFLYSRHDIDNYIVLMSFFVCSFVKLPLANTHKDQQKLKSNPRKCAKANFCRNLSFKLKGQMFILKITGMKMAF